MSNMIFTPSALIAIDSGVSQSEPITYEIHHDLAQDVDVVYYTLPTYGFDEILRPGDEDYEQALAAAKEAAAIAHREEIAPISGATFSPDAVTVNGITSPVRYRLHCNSVTVRLDGQSYLIRKDDPEYTEAAKAARAQEDALYNERKQRLEAAKADGSKAWIGQTIQGTGWKIYANELSQRIEVTFDKFPTERQKQLVKDHKFCWSPTNKSWNRGLKCKAWRDAEHLAQALSCSSWAV